MTIPRCRRCHRVLRDPDSIGIGFGRTCFEKTTGRKIGKQGVLRANSRSSKSKRKPESCQKNMNIFEFLEEVKEREVDVETGKDPIQENSLAADSEWSLSNESS